MDGDQREGWREGEFDTTLEGGAACRQRMVERIAINAEHTRHIADYLQYEVFLMVFYFLRVLVNFSA